MSEDELIANYVSLFVAGHETAMHLISNGVLVLLNQPDQWTLLHDNHASTGFKANRAMTYAPPD